MLYIQLKSGAELNWHVGDNSHAITINLIDNISADGDELEYILKTCKNIPTAKNKKELYWFGDHAKFIAKTINAVVDVSLDFRG